MREHALPQDVTGYRFHIIGNMTLKQFAEMGLGCILGVVTYATNLPDIIKWPLILFWVAAGSMVAFVPFEERPLDHWVITFFRVLYKPTQFYWLKEAKIPDPFLFTPSSYPDTELRPSIDLTPIKKERVKEFLQSIEPEAQTDLLSQYHQQRYNEVMGLFTDLAQVPNFEEQLSTGGFEPRPNTTSPTSSSGQASTGGFQTRPDTAPNTLNQAGTGDSRVAPTPAPSFPSNPTPPPQVFPDQIQNSTPVASQPKPVKEDLIIPEQQMVHLDPTQINSDTSLGIETPDLGETAYSTTLNNSSVASLADTILPLQVNPNLPFPNPPREPNRLVGMIFDLQNQPLQGVIVEIMTRQGDSARAVRTNLLGQFSITTPLGDGEYLLRAEKDGFHFPQQSFVLQNTIVPPIEVRAV